MSPELGDGLPPQLPEVPAGPGTQRKPGCGITLIIGIHNLMEDAATAELSHSQIGQWVHNDVRFDTGETVTPQFVRRILDEELAGCTRRLLIRRTALADSRRASVFRTSALADDFVDFLTMPVYAMVGRGAIRPPLTL